jgi:hypothetical protein
MTSPTSRSLKYLRNSGYVAEVVERWIPLSPSKDPKPGKQPSAVRRDLFGCIDIVGVHRGRPGALGVQATSASNVSARLTKARSVRELVDWLEAGNQFQVHGWWQDEATGRWHVRVAELTRGDLRGAVLLSRGRKPRVKQREMWE